MLRVFASTLLMGCAPLAAGAQWSASKSVDAGYASRCVVAVDPRQGCFARGPEVAMDARSSFRLFSAWNGTSRIYGLYVTFRRAPSDPEFGWDRCDDERGVHFALTPIGSTHNGGVVTEIVQIVVPRARLDSRTEGFRLRAADAELRFRVPALEVDRFLAVADAARDVSLGYSARNDTPLESFAGARK